MLCHTPWFLACSLLRVTRLGWLSQHTAGCRRGIKAHLSLLCLCRSDQGTSQLPSAMLEVLALLWWP